MAIARLSDVELSRPQVSPGDRVVVRTCCDLVRSDVSKIERAVVKAAKCELKVLAINCMKFNILHVRDRRPYQLLSGREYATTAINSIKGVFTISFSKIDLEIGDVLLVTGEGSMTLYDRYLLREGLKIWAGAGVSVRAWPAR